MSKLANLARMTTATVGTGTLTLGAAVSGYLTFAAAGITDQQIVSYGIRDGANSEVGLGVYTASGTTLSRTVTSSTNSNAAISLSGTAEVFITVRAQDVKESFFYGLNLVGGSIVCSVAASALTIAIKTDSGADPSPADPVNVIFRNVTPATGDSAQLSLTAATSLTITSGATMGAVNALPFRLWVVGFNDAGTFRLGVINCMSRSSQGFQANNVSRIFPLDSWNVKSSTIMSATSDNAAIYYTGTAVTSKPFTILGFLDYDSGLATAGTWSAVPTRIALWRLGMPLPGNIIQTAIAEGGTTTSRTSSAFAASVITGSITPVGVMHAILINIQSQIECSSETSNAQGVIRRGTATNVGIAQQSQISGTGASGSLTIVMFALDAPGTIASQAYTVYVASGDNTSTISFPQSSWASPNWSIRLDEIMT